MKKDMLTSARSTNQRFGISSTSVLLSPLSPSYIAGKMMIVRAIAADCKVVFTTPSNRFWHQRELREFIGQSRPTLLPIVPSQTDDLLRDTDSLSEIVRSVGAIIIGGAPLATATEGKLRELAPNFYATYGMTETCSHVALRPLGVDHFTAMPGVTFSIDSRNCLKIDAPDFSFKTLQTNDVVDLLDPHTFIWRGRFDSVINSGGIKIFPEEIERMLRQTLPISLFIKGIPHPKWGETVEIVVEESAAITDGEIMAACRSILPRHAIPTSIRRIKEFPLTSTGKVRRNSL